MHVLGSDSIRMPLSPFYGNAAVVEAAGRSPAASLQRFVRPRWRHRCLIEARKAPKTGIL